MTAKKPGPKITRRKVDDYQQDEGNPNAGSRRGQEMIDASYRQHGAGRSWLADKERRLIEGNHSQVGALEAGIEEVWEIEAPPDVQVVVVRPDLDLEDPDTGARELSIGANRSAQASISFDVEQLLKAEEGGADLNTFWRDDELDDLFQAHEVETAIETELEANQEENTQKRKLGERKKQVKPVLYVEMVETFEQALRATGISNRGQALIRVCEVFLEGVGAEFDELLKDVTAKK